MIAQLVPYVVALAVGCALASLARRINIPYPILLVPVGVVIGFVPGIPAIVLNPDMVLNCCLPLVVYAAAAFTSWRDFWSDIRAISLLAVGCVLFTALTVAAVAHFLIPGFTWPVALILGAIVAPPDEVAAIQILRRLGIPRRVLVVIEGEGMVNDATALTLYRIAVAGMATQNVGVSHGAFLFLSVMLCEVTWGLAVGWAVHQIRMRSADALTATVISLLTPFLAYWPAEQLGGSGVLATVAAAIYVGTRNRAHDVPRIRIREAYVWTTIDFLLNSLLFLIAGLQLRGILVREQTAPLGSLILDCVLVSVIVVASRFVWVFPATYLPRWLVPSIRRRDPYPPWQYPFTVAFTGLRGTISLATAIALPTMIDQQPFAPRDLIILLTFAVIITTLVGQGLLLPTLIIRLGLGERHRSEQESTRQMEIAARLAAAKAGQGRLGELPKERLGRYFVDFLSKQYESRVDFLNARRAAQESHEDIREMLRVLRQLRTSEHREVVRIRRQGDIGDAALERVQEDIDLEALKFESEL